MASTQPFPSVKTQFLINDGHDRTDRLTQANLCVTAQVTDLLVEYERRDGSAGKLILPVNAVTQAFDAAGISPRPMTIKAFSCQDLASRAYGPYTRPDTAEAIARSKGVSVTESSWIVWRESDGTLMGMQATGMPVRLWETDPKDAAVAAVLARLDPDDRALLEAALAR